MKQTQTHPEFKRVQQEITGTPKQHYIPYHIYKFARDARDDQAASGAEKEIIPTLADIYYQLICEGLDLVRSGARPVFIEVGRPKGCRAVQITYPKELLNDGPEDPGELNELKRRAEAGEFEFGPFKTISVLGVTVALMEEAIAARETW